MNPSFMHIKTIFFDADDTLWVNETHYRNTERAFFKLIGLNEQDGIRELLHTEMQNMPLYGYGAKAFTLSMLETAQRILGAQQAAAVTAPVLELGKKLIAAPMELLPGVRQTLQELAPFYTLAVATKGDLLDQQRKLQNSGLRDFFAHAEIMTDKTPQAYLNLCRALKTEPAHTLMVGNSLRSDILPALEAGLQAVYIPCQDGWIYEEAPNTPLPDFVTLKNIQELPALLKGETHA